MLDGEDAAQSLDIPCYHVRSARVAPLLMIGFILELNVPRSWHARSSVTLLSRISRLGTPRRRRGIKRTAPAPSEESIAALWST